MKLEDGRILITGASGGIGCAIARALHRRGCALLLHGNQCRSNVQGDNIVHVQGDLTTVQGREDVVAAAVSFGINVLINSAGINQFSAFEHNDVTRIIDVNVTAPMTLTQMLVPHLTDQPSATILNVGSAFGHIGFPGYVSYCASKHAMKGFTEALKRELSDSRVRVQYVSPRETNTHMNDDAATRLNVTLGNTSDEPDYVAEEVVSALASGKSRVQIGNTESLQVRLNSIFPGLVDLALAKQLSVIKQHFHNTP